ncbi:MAG: sulfite exporter TauE/SafE family protein [Eubacteriales bacterium]
MNIKDKFQKSRPKKRAIVNIAVGLFSGIINGFLGSAGGIAVVECLELEGYETKVSHATALLVILPLSILSVIFYAGSGYLEVNSLIFLSIGSLIGGILGAMLLKKASPKFINRLFTLIIIVCGVRMLF